MTMRTEKPPTSPPLSPIIVARSTIIICIQTVGCWFVFIPWKLDMLDLAKKDFGYVLLAFGIGSILSMQITNKVLIPRIGPQCLLPIGMIAFSIALYSWVTSPGIMMFAILAFPVGFTFGLINPSATVITVAAERETGRRLLPLHHACFSVGSLMGIIVSSLYAATELPPEWLFFTLMLVGILGGAVCYLLSDARIVRTVKATSEAAQQLRLPSGDTLVFGSIAAVSMGTVGIILDWSALWLTRDIGLVLALGGIGIFAFNGTEVLARLFGERIITRFGERVVGTWAMLVGCLIMIAATYSRELIPIVIAFGAFGLCSANFLPLLMGVAARRNPDNAAGVVSDITTVSFVGFLIGPPIVGLIAEYVSISACMYLLAGIWMVTSLFMRQYFRPLTKMP